MECTLLERKCTPCRGGVPPLAGEELRKYCEELGGGWSVADGLRIEKEFKFKDFREALDFTNAVGVLAEEEGHHPDICLSWGKVRIVLTTHKIHGLSGNDFILAAKIDAL